MIEVFKTNVQQQAHASMLMEEIHNRFYNYKANFDLEDCDNILRVASNTPTVDSISLIQLLNEFGFHAEVLPGDEDLVDLSCLKSENSKCY